MQRCWLGALLLRFLVRAWNAHVYATEQKQNVYMHITVPQSPVAPAPAVSLAPAPAVSVASSAAAGHCACQQRTKRKRSERVGRSGRKVHTAADCYGASSRADVFGSCSAGLLAERAMQER